ncbi:MAG: zinc ribbon domain-containing protein [Anaerolineaceae bacterium]
MPIYEYTCQDCNARFEILRPMQEADAPLTCTQCQGHHLKRSLSLFNASSAGRIIAGGGQCSTCSGGSCSSCGSH